jgi:hypothetical protein
MTANANRSEQKPFFNPNKFTLNAVPFSVTQIVLLRRSEGGEEGLLSIVDADLDGAVDHLQHEVVALSVGRHQDAVGRARTDFQLDVDLQTHFEILD